MRRDHVHLDGADLIAYGHWGRPVLLFPAEAGRAWDLEDNGLIGAVADLVDAGRVKLYAVDSADAWTWSARDVSIEERAQRHGVYENWLLNTVVPWIAADCGGAGEIITVGASLGAYHAANIALKHANVFPLAICMSGNYDPTTWHAWGEPGDATYFNNPFAYVPNLGGDHLSWLRERLSLLLVVGRGAWEVSPTQALPSTRAFADVLGRQEIRHELDVWGHDVPHDWPSWQRQLAHHLPRFC
ncbi:esterase family protein [Jatrophihabitans fulvus]